ncbi:hypothetical protein [Pedobacter sp. Leaf176]|uniref:hypothetical protein n=1 Tax=Pedobacter sp. Leaf176 TaxID=1736286 RepID=UPI0007002712|nr:hypothetical protein [Pedobacter sp. Leaf176]KQR71209.1 hypothetical protein ASF92_07430 [Pedobacter sp. Leaf176]
MSTSDSNLEDINSKTPAQMIESFYNTHTIDKVKLTLLEAFQGYALNDKSGFLKLDIGEEQVSEVFDSLIELVRAIETLIEEGKIEGVKS